MRLAEAVAAVYRQPGSGTSGWGRLQVLTPVGAHLESLEAPPEGIFLLDLTLRGEEFTGMSCAAVRRGRQEDGYWTAELRFTEPAEIRRLRDCIARVLLTSP